MEKKQYSSENQRFKGVLPTGDPFVDECFSFDFCQKIEDRSAAGIEELKEVPALVKGKQYSQAWDILEKHQDEFKNFDFIYTWKAVVLQKNRQTQEAFDTLRQGLKNSKEKHVLCDRIGLLAYETGQINQAVKWWIRSIALMMNSRKVTSWEPFLYLAHIVRECGSEKLFNSLMTQVDKICIQGTLRFEKDAEKLLKEKTKVLSAKSVISAIEILYNAFKKDLVQHSTTNSRPGHNHNSENKAIVKRKKIVHLWLALGAFIIICLAVYLFMLTPSETIRPLTDTQEQAEPPKTIATPFVLETEPKEIPKVTLAAKRISRTDPKDLPHKKKLPNLKAKTKTINPDIKKKTSD